MSESTLLERLGARDRSTRESAERELYESFAPRVRAVLSRVVGHGPELDDAVQEVFVDVLRGLSRFEGRADLATWIYRIALRRGWKHVARERRSRESSADVSTVPSPAAETRATDELDARELAKRLEAALRQLDFDQRSVIALSASDDLTPAQIAATLGIPVGTVHSRLSRAWAKLRELLGAG